MPPAQRSVRDRPPIVLFGDTWTTHYARLDRTVGFDGSEAIFVGGTLLGRVPCLAIAEDSDGVWWLVHCGRTWNMRTAWPHASLADAQASAERRYPGSSSRWKATGYSKAKAESYLDRLWKSESCSFCGRRPDQIDQMFTGRRRPVARICVVCLGRMAPKIGVGGTRRADVPAADSFLSACAPLEVHLESRFVVLIDPLALDLLREPLQRLSSRSEAHRLEQLRRLTTTLRIGVREIPAFAPGRYRVGPDDLAPARRMGGDVVDVDSGAVVVTGLDSLPRIARTLTWERYDALTGAQADSTARWFAKVVGPRFVILQADADRPFSGDGSYRLARGAPARTEPAISLPAAPASRDRRTPA